MTKIDWSTTSRIVVSGAIRIYHAILPSAIPSAPEAATDGDEDEVFDLRKLCMMEPCVLTERVEALGAPRHAAATGSGGVEWWPALHVLVLQLERRAAHAFACSRCRPLQEAMV